MVAIIDFNDSFTYNIACELSSIGREAQVINYQHSDFNFFHLKKFSHIIWGPGPGHPNDYLEAQEILKMLFLEPIEHLGICLGHQMIWTTLGYEIKKLKMPFHGISKKIYLDDFWSALLNTDFIRAQFYNSLHLSFDLKMSDANVLVTNFNGDNSVVASFGNNFVTYQFHPESIGTYNSSLFFKTFFNKNLRLKV